MIVNDERHLMYLLGEPGIGKSALMAALVYDAHHEVHEQPFLHCEYHEQGVVMLGGFRPQYPGTDMLAFDAQPAVLRWMYETRPALVMGEGARLGHASFFQQAQRQGYTLHLYNLEGIGLARARRGDRDEEQAASFIKGRRTESAAITIHFGGTTINPTFQPNELVRLLNDPVSRAFR